MTAQTALTHIDIEVRAPYLRFYNGGNGIVHAHLFSLSSASKQRLLSNINIYIELRKARSDMVARVKKGKRERITNK